jgi:hypothetical protein
VLDALADFLDDARAFVTEQDGQPMSPAAGLEEVQIGVADAARLDPDTRFAGAGRVKLELSDLEAALRRQDYAAIHDSTRTEFLIFYVRPTWARGPSGRGCAVDRAHWS